MRGHITATIVAAFLVVMLGAEVVFEPAAAQESEPDVAVTVDDLSDGFRRVGADWRSSAGGFQGHHDWIPTSQTLGRVGIWTATLGESGLYEILAKLPRRHASTRAAVYKVKTANGWVARTRNQYDRRGRWVSLGTHMLAATAEVRLGDKSLDTGGHHKIAFDAIRFVPVEAPQPPVISGLDVKPGHDRAIATFDIVAAGSASTEYRRLGDARWREAVTPSSKSADRRVVIGDLKAETRYEMRVVATNPGGKTASRIVRFTTLAQPRPVIRNLRVIPADTRATVTFRVTENGSARIEYRVRGDGQWLIGARVARSRHAKHRHVIKHLAPQTAYGLRVVVSNAGRRTVSRVVHFKTGPRLVDCDSGEKLQRAIDRARPGDTILIHGTCHGTFAADKALTLRGRGEASLRGPGSGTVLSIDHADPAASSPGFKVKVKRLQISGGTTGVSVQESMNATLGRIRIQGNRRNGLSLSSFSTATLTGSTIRGSRDGIINNHAILTVRDSSIVNNRLRGILNQQQGSIRLQDSLVGGSGGRGIRNENASVQLVRSTVSDNADGGIYSDDLSYLTVHDSYVVDNQTAGPGGGIHIADPWSIASGGVTIEDSVIRGNSAGGHGGGIYRQAPSDRGEPFRTDVIARVKIRANRAGEEGGGMWNGGGPLSLAGISFRGNSPNDCTGC